MKAKVFSLVLVLAILGFAFPTAALADGIIIPEPPLCGDRPCPPTPCPPESPCVVVPPMAQLAIRYHHVTVTIQDQVAITHVDQVFFNPNEWTVEGTYIFPLPLDAAVTSFTLWVDGKPVEGKVLDAKQARQTYEEIVRSMRDPALLEYADRGAVQASIFPIPPQGERRIELEYTQALTAENGLVRYVYPLGTEKFSAMPLESVSISVDVRSGVPIRAAYSPSHTVSIDREDDHHVMVGYEDSNVLPDADFSLYYSLGEEQAFHLLSYRDPGDSSDPDGFFLLLLAPRPDVSTETLSKDVILVLDHSGSMEGEKFQQAQEALRFILRHLNPEDRFNIIAFSTGMDAYARGLRPASEAEEALPWVNRLSAEGSTDINRALLEAAAIADRERPTYLIFLTDGLPTVGEVDSQKILDNFAESARSNLRLFAFGVGYDVDTFLLDSLAQAHHGTSTYVLPGERLDETLSTFYERISTPVLTDLNLDFGDLAVYDIYPSPLPDLFSGSQIVVTGRYRQGGTADVTLSGKVNGNTQTFRYPGQAFTSRSAASDGTLTTLPRLWATRKIGYLLSQIRLHGADQETIDQIVRLSIRYGIVTPYTSYLVTEPMILGEAGADRIAQQELSTIEAMPTAEAYGRAAVEKAAGQGALSGADSASIPPADVANTVRIIGARTFVLVGDTWTDTAFDPQSMQTVKVAFLSDDYFALSEGNPELAAAFALGLKVIALSGGVAYEVVDSGAKVEPLDLPTTAPEPDITRTPAPRPTQAPAPGTMPCAGGLLPLVILPLGLALIGLYKKMV
jgi:Ca-activated chloride channel family protein